MALPELGKRGRARSCGQWNPASRPGAGGLLSRSSLAPTSSLWGSRCTCEAEHVQGWLPRGPGPTCPGRARPPWEQVSHPGLFRLAQGNPDAALTAPELEAADWCLPALTASQHGLCVSIGNALCFNFVKLS